VLDKKRKRGRLKRQTEDAPTKKQKKNGVKAKVKNKINLLILILT
jgi:hypothetical protein